MGEQSEAQAVGRGGRGARGRIIEAAADLFYHEGINATGVERLAHEASVSKRTLYQHFPSKAAVVEEYLQNIRQFSGDPIHPSLLDADRPPRARLLALFDNPGAKGTIRGCPFHNAAVEAADDMPEIRDVVRAYKRQFINGVAKLAKQAGADNPRSLANQLVVLYEGAAALSTSLNDPAPWANARRAAQILVDQATAGR